VVARQRDGPHAPQRHLSPAAGRVAPPPGILLGRSKHHDLARMERGRARRQSPVIESADRGRRWLVGRAEATAIEVGPVLDDGQERHGRNGRGEVSRDAEGEVRPERVARQRVRPRPPVPQQRRIARRQRRQVGVRSPGDLDPAGVKRGNRQIAAHGLCQRTGEVGGSVDVVGQEERRAAVTGLDVRQFDR
jgi:hypothetical protein